MKRRVGARALARSNWKPTSLRNAGLAPVTPVNPVQTNIAAWYKFNQGITVVTGASVWADLKTGGTPRDLLMASTTRQPLVQGDGSLLFDGVDDYMLASAFTLNQPCSFVFRGKQITWTEGDTIHAGLGNNILMYQGDSTTPRLSAYAGSAVGPVSPALNTMFSSCCVYNGASSFIQLNGGAAVTGNPGANNAGGVSLGARSTPSSYAHCQAYELIVYNAALSEAEGASIHNAYLSTIGA